MPRIRPWTLALLAIVAVAALGVLYVMFGRPVHAPGPPAALAPLQAVAPTKLPDVTFADSAGRHHALSAFKGRYVLLNLWATWCAPCVRELPALAKLQASMPPGGLAVVAVDMGHANPAETLAFLKAHDASALGAYFDSDYGLTHVFGEVGLPLSVLFDRQGREVARASGPAEWDDPAAIAYFKSLTVHAAS